MHDLLNCDGDDLINDECNIDVATKMFIDTIDQYYCNNLRVKIKYTSQKRHIKPWVTPKLRRLVNEKSKCINCTGWASMHTIYCFRNNVNRKVKEATINHYNKMFKT